MAAASPAIAQETPPRAVADAGIHGTVTTLGGLVGLSGVAVTLIATADGGAASATTGEGGAFSIAGLRPGPWTATFTLDGYRSLVVSTTLARGRTQRMDADLARTGVVDQTEVVPRAADAAIAATLSGKDLLEGPFLQRSPLPEDALRGTLLSLPGVVRTPEGLSIRGGRPNQAVVQIAAVAVIEPATGPPPLRVPVGSFVTIDFLSNPHPVEFGRFSSGVALVSPQPGSGRWRFTLNNPLPGLRTQRKTPLKILGLGTFAPRAGVGGPVVKDRLFLSSSLQYRYSLSDVRSRPQRELTRQRYVSGLARLDSRIGQSQRFTTVVNLFPELRKSVNLDTFTPPESTFDQRQQTLNTVLAHTFVARDRVVVASTVTLSRYDARIDPHGDQVMTITPSGVSGSHFLRQRRKTQGVHWTESMSVLTRRPEGEHLLKVGFEWLGARYEGSSQSDPIEIRRLDGTLARRVRFFGPTAQRVDSSDFGAYVQDRWRPSRRALIETGVRIDRDGAFGQVNVTPRGGVTVVFGPRDSMTMTGGGGLYYERSPSYALAFEQYEAREVATFAADGLSPVGPTLRLIHHRSETLDTPRSRGWNVAFTHRATRTLTWRAGHLRRIGSHGLVVDIAERAGAPALSLSATGRSRYVETEFGASYAPDSRAEFRFSYVHASAEGDLNDYASLFGADREALVRANQYGPLPGDLRHRALVQSSYRPTPDWSMEGVLEARSGFPWSAVDEYFEFVGPRGRGGRFPWVTLLEVSVERRLRLFGWQPWIGFRVYNLLNSFAPADVRANVTSPSFGAFYNQLIRRASLILRIER